MKDSQRRHLEKQDEGLSNLITPEMMAEYEQRESIQKAVSLIHYFHNGGRSAEPGDNSMKMRSQRPQSILFVYCSMASSSSGLHGNSSNVMLLSEDDIPGASLLGRKLEEHKTAELRLWLKCRDDSCKCLKTKAELVK